MRIQSGFLISLGVHLLVVLLGLFGGFMGPTLISLDAPVYQVELMALPAPGPATKPGEAPGPEAEKPAETPSEQPADKAEPIKAEPKPEPPKPEPPKPQPKPEPPKPEPPKPEPPKPQPKPEAPKPQDISPAKTQQPKKEEKKAPEPSPQELLAQALSSAKTQAAKQQKAETSALAKELAALRKTTPSGTPGGGGGGGGVPGATGSSAVEQVYGAVVVQVVKPNWRYPTFRAAENLQAVVDIDLDPSGKILASRLVTSSGKIDFDNSVIKAIDETKMLPPPPSPRITKLRVTFNLQEMIR